MGLPRKLRCLALLCECVGTGKVKPANGEPFKKHTTSGRQDRHLYVDQKGET